MEMYGLRIAIWAQAPVWNMTNARTPFPTTFWDATITLTHSHPTSLWENVSISKMATDSVWLDVSKHAERLVLCLRDWGKLFIEILISTFCIRDRQFCHCGNVEPPTEFKVDLEKCGTSCPKTPNDLGIVDPCGTTLHTMVSYHPFEIIPKICST